MTLDDRIALDLGRLLLKTEQQAAEIDDLRQRIEDLVHELEALKNPPESP